MFPALHRACFSMSCFSLRLMTNLENSIYFDGFAPLIRIKSVKA